MERNQQPDPELETYDLQEPSSDLNSSAELLDNPKSDSVDQKNGPGQDVNVPLLPESSPSSEKKVKEAKASDISKPIPLISEEIVPIGHKPAIAGQVPKSKIDSPAEKPEEEKLIPNPEVPFAPEPQRAQEDVEIPKEPTKHLAQIQKGIKLLFISVSLASKGHWLGNRFASEICVRKRVV